MFAEIRRITFGNSEARGWIIELCSIILRKFNFVEFPEGPAPAPPPIEEQYFDNKKWSQLKFDLVNTR